MYKYIGIISKTTVFQLKEIANKIERWEIHDDDMTKHHAAGCMDLVKNVKGIIDLWPIDKCKLMTFLRLPPGGKLYRHYDDGIGYTIPIETNEWCVCLSYNGKQKESRLEVGKIYLTDRSIEHESYNKGKTNRTHLLVRLIGE